MSSLSPYQISITSLAYGFLTFDPKPYVSPLSEGQTWEERRSSVNANIKQ